MKALTTRDFSTDENRSSRLATVAVCIKNINTANVKEMKAEPVSNRWKWMNWLIPASLAVRSAGPAPSLRDTTLPYFVTNWTPVYVMSEEIRHSQDTICLFGFMHTLYVEISAAPGLAVPNNLAIWSLAERNVTLNQTMISFAIIIFKMMDLMERKYQQGNINKSKDEKVT